MAYPFAPRPTVDQFVAILRNYGVVEMPLHDLQVLVSIRHHGAEADEEQDGRSVLFNGPDRIWVVHPNRQERLTWSVVRSACLQLGIDVKTIVELGLNMG